MYRGSTQGRRKVGASPYTKEVAPALKLGDHEWVAGLGRTSVLGPSRPGPAPIRCKAVWYGAPVLYNEQHDVFITQRLWPWGRAPSPQPRASNVLFPSPAPGSSAFFSHFFWPSSASPCLSWHPVADRLCSPLGGLPGFGNRDPHGRARGVHRRCRRRPRCAIQAVIRSGGRRLAIDTSERAARNEPGSKAGRRRGH